MAKIKTWYNAAESKAIHQLADINKVAIIATPLSVMLHFLHSSTKRRVHPMEYRKELAHHILPFRGTEL